MRFLLAIITPFVMAMLALVTATMQILTGLFSGLDLSPDTRTRGPTFFSGLRSMLVNIATAATYIFGATRHETLTLVGTIRSSPLRSSSHDTARRAATRGPTHTSLVVGGLTEVILGVRNGLLNTIIGTIGRVAQIPIATISSLIVSTTARTTPDPAVPRTGSLLTA